MKFGNIFVRKKWNEIATGDRKEEVFDLELDFSKRCFIQINWLHSLNEYHISASFRERYRNDYRAIYR
jgi:hypothetical protein